MSAIGELVLVGFCCVVLAAVAVAAACGAGLCVLIFVRAVRDKD